jgi:acetyl-CoA/propionyl-CoA carboxylase biotin carboxyl carrier protein
MLGKVIVHGEDRQAALAKLDRALAQTSILGVTTTTGFLRSLIATDEVRSGAIDTGLIERLPAPRATLSDEVVARAAAIIALALREERRDDDVFTRVDGWRLSGRRARSWWRLAVAGGEAVEVSVDGLESSSAAERTGPQTFAVTEDGSRREWSYADADGVVAWLGAGGWAWPVREAVADQADEGRSDGALRAPMPGQVLLVPASMGQLVRAGDPVVVLESMKMELVMSAPVDGLVAEVNVAVGDKVALDQPLARVQAGDS